ncbi:hypothetical protein GCM10027161_61040 [Microbispora hainanensis]
MQFDANIGEIVPTFRGADQGVSAGGRPHGMTAIPRAQVFVITAPHQVLSGAAGEPPRAAATPAGRGRRRVRPAFTCVLTSLNP